MSCVVVDPADYPRLVEELDRERRAVARLPLRADAQGVSAHRDVRRHDRDDADRCRRGRRRDDAPADCRPVTALEGRCATARTRTRRVTGQCLPRKPAADGRCTRARSCRTRTCSISTRRCASRSSSTSRPRVVIKHTNPCGVATGALPPTPTSGRATPIRSPRSAASSASTVRSTRATATALTSTFIEAVIAPVDRRRCPPDPGDEGQPARRHRRLRSAAAGRAPSDERDADVPRRRAAAGARSRSSKRARPGRRETIRRS